MGHGAQPVGQRVDGIERARQEAERRDDKVGEGRQMVEFLRDDPADQARQRQHRAAGAHGGDGGGGVRRRRSAADADRRHAFFV